MHLNLVHVLFIHGFTRNFYDQPGLDKKMKNFTRELCEIMEYYADGVDNDALKEEMNYKPFPSEET